MHDVHPLMQKFQSNSHWQNLMPGAEIVGQKCASARQGIVVVRGRTVEWRDEVVYWIYVAGTANTLVWLWGGLGQLCLIGWGRRRFDVNGSLPPVRKDDGSEM